MVTSRRMDKARCSSEGNVLGRVALMNQQPIKARVQNAFHIDQDIDRCWLN